LHLTIGWSDWGSFGKVKRGSNDWDKASSFSVSARRSTSSLDVMDGNTFKLCVLSAYCAIGALATVPVHARCVGESLVEVRSLVALPPGVRRLLPSETTGLAGIADAGADFNLTDVVDRQLSMKRFTLAAVGKTCALVGIEIGGYSHHYQIEEYRLVGAEWQLNGRDDVGGRPRSVDDLLNLPRLPSG